MKLGIVGLPNVGKSTLFNAITNAGAQSANYPFCTICLLYTSRGVRLLPGMTIAIEPMVNAGTKDVIVQKDGWTTVTADGKLSAHFEHTIAVTSNGPVILTLPD